MHCLKLESASNFELQFNMHTYVYAHLCVHRAGMFTFSDNIQDCSTSCHDTVQANVLASRVKSVQT